MNAFVGQKLKKSISSKLVSIFCDTVRDGKLWVGTLKKTNEKESINWALIDTHAHARMLFRKTIELGQSLELGQECEFFVPTRTVRGVSLNISGKSRISGSCWSHVNAFIYFYWCYYSWRKRVGKNLHNNLDQEFSSRMFQNNRRTIKRNAPYRMSKSL